MTASIRTAAGSLLAVGIEGMELTALERAWLKLIQPAGIILFHRNIEDAKQSRALLVNALQFSAPHSARFVDVEGGTVDRLRDALAPIPPVELVATAALAGKRPALARQHGELIARAIQAFGFNSPLAPVLDLGLPESKSVMQTRCAGASADDVVAYAREFLSGLAAHGVAGCGKHFPGLGGGTLDSHLETPQIRRSWPKLWQDDLEPYRALSRQLPMIMINHAAYPLSADKKQPASVSKFWVGDVLRKHLGYRGIVLSDDLEMGGVSKFMPVGDAAVAAVRVGSDMLLVCHHPEPIFAAFEALIAEAERSSAFRTLLLASARDAARKRAKFFRAAIPPALNKRQFDALRAEILRFTATVEKLAAAPEKASA